MSYNKDLPLHVGMYPWFAMGHITSFLRLANKLAERGHKISFFIPAKTQLRFVSSNHHPDLITLIPVTLPSVEGLPSGAETTNDVPDNVHPLLMTSMDLTRETIDAHLTQLKPNIVCYDFAHWVPEVAKKHGIKSIFYLSGLMVRFAYVISRGQAAPKDTSFVGADLMRPPPSFPSEAIKLQAHEARALAGSGMIDFGGGMSMAERIIRALIECDAIGIKSCKEMEGPYCDYVEKNLGKPVFTAGPVVPDPQTTKLDAHFDEWLKGFSNHSVVYCALGSQCTLENHQFQELVLGLELTGRAFLAALKPPAGYETIEEALPEGFTERTKGRGIIFGGWLQQQLILQHPSVGCFVTHCGAGSLSEALVSKCQIVMIPQAVDQFVNARFMSLELKVGVEVEKEEDDGFVTSKAVSNAVSMVMEENSEVAREVKANHTKWREFIMREGIEESYINSFTHDLCHMLDRPSACEVENHDG